MGCIISALSRNGIIEYDSITHGQNEFPGFNFNNWLFNTIKPSCKIPDNANNTCQASLPYLLKENDRFIQQFRQSSLMKLINSAQMKNKAVRDRLLDCIQLFSNNFQDSVLMRHILTDKPLFQHITQQHLNEEFNHNVSLLIDRQFRPPIWDAVLASSSTWFIWKMLTLNDIEKTFLMHFILESSAHIFFEQADRIMSAYNETHYFSLHSTMDERHDAMGLEQLENLREAEYVDLFQLQSQGWSMLYTACNRIAKLTLDIQSNQEIERIIKHNKSMRESIN